MEKPSRCSASMAAGKLLVGMEIFSPPARQLCRAERELGAHPAPPGPQAQRLKDRDHADSPEPTPSSGGSSRAESPRFLPQGQVPPWCHRVTRMGTSGSRIAGEGWCAQQDRASSGSPFLAASPAEVRWQRGHSPSLGDQGWLGPQQGSQGSAHRLSRQGGFSPHHA